MAVRQGTRLTLLAMSLGFAVVQLDVSVVNVAIRPIGDALGGGVGLVVPLMTSELLGSVDRARSGAASGTLNTMRHTGSVIGVALYGSLVAGSSVVSGLHAALGGSVGALLCTGALARLA